MTSDLSAQLVLVHIGSGRDNARSLSEIAEEMGWSRRAVELAVRELRLAGSPIASDGSGIWWTTAAADMEATFRQLRHRVTSQVVTSWAVRATARRMRAGDQLTLFKEGEAA